MMRFVVLLALWFSVPVMVQAQGLRVSTIVYDAGRLDSSGQEPILSTGFSLFHNGRVYDYVEAVGEVVIFEPSDKRFTILNPAGKVRTTVAFGEVQHLLESREPRTQEYIRELSAADSPEAERASRVLEFQMNPKFETVYDRRTGLLKLSAPSWKYSVSTREWQNPDQIKHYLAYADWTARLNYVLHPSSMFPEPRLVLNEELRKLENRIPVVVQLDLRPDERRVLRAEHQFVKSLTDQDHSLISSWDAAAKAPDVKQIPFRSYQEAILMSWNR